MFRRIVSAALAVALLWGGLTPVWAEMSFPDSDTETSASEEFPTLSLGDRDGTPRLALPLAGGVGRRYPVGTVKVRAR